MKKVICLLLVTVLCGLSVRACGNDYVIACEVLSNDNQVCSVNKDGKCECINVITNTRGLDREDNGN